MLIVEKKCNNKERKFVKILKWIFDSLRMGLAQYSTGSELRSVAAWSTKTTYATL